MLCFNLETCLYEEWSQAFYHIQEQCHLSSCGSEHLRSHCGKSQHFILKVSPRLSRPVAHAACVVLPGCLEAHSFSQQLQISILSQHNSPPELEKQDARSDHVLHLVCVCVCVWWVWLWYSGLDVMLSLIYVFSHGGNPQFTMKQRRSRKHAGWWPADSEMQHVKETLLTAWYEAELVGWFERVCCMRRPHFFSIFIDLATWGQWSSPKHTVDLMSWLIPNRRCG